MHQKGFTVWLTGLSGSGKTTLAKALAVELQNRGRQVEVLDGDHVRANLSKELGFSKEDRDTQIRRIGYVAHLLSRNGVAVICAAISPYRAVRDENRRLIGNFIEIYVSASVETCAKRDVKGLYKKALDGEIKNFTGVSDPYEAPEHPEMICETETESVADCTINILEKLAKMGYLTDNPKVDNDEKLKERLKGLGYL